LDSLGIPTALKSRGGASIPSTEKLGSSAIGRASVARDIQSTPVSGQGISQDANPPGDSQLNSLLPLLAQILNLMTQLIKKQQGQTAQQPAGTGGSSALTDAGSVDGCTGPYCSGQPGGFGRNAFENHCNVSKSQRDVSAEGARAIRYTPKDSPRFDDVFGFAEQEIKFRDKDKDGFLSLRERPGASILDRNRDGRLDPVELGSGLLLMDKNGDGQISPEERSQMRGDVKNASERVGQLLGDLEKTLDLKKKYQDYKQKQTR
jgi:hypothetical protein